MKEQRLLYSAAGGLLVMCIGLIADVFEILSALSIGLDVLKPLLRLLAIFVMGTTIVWIVLSTRVWYRLRGMRKSTRFRRLRGLLYDEAQSIEDKQKYQDSVYFGKNGNAVSRRREAVAGSETNWLASSSISPKTAL